MVTVGYGILLAISILVIVYVIQKDYENLDIQSWTIVILIPLVVLGYMLKTMVTTEEAARLAFCFIYLDSTVMLMLMIFGILRFLGVRVRPWVKILGYGVAFLHLIIVWIGFQNHLYYDTMTLVDTGIGISTQMTDGPLKIFHWVYLMVVLGVILSLIVIAIHRRGSYSRRTMMLYSVVVSLGIVIYAVEFTVNLPFSLLPILYVTADVVIVLNYDIAYSHNITNLIAEQQINFGNTGYVALDLEGRFLSCNTKAYEYLPRLAGQIIDNRIPAEEGAAAVFYELMEEYRSTGVNYRDFPTGDKITRCEITEFAIHKNGASNGYLLNLRDVTEEQKMLHLMRDYNNTLNSEVNKKTENIKKIQQRVVLGLANMVENRDNNTGGHVKRTSDIIRYLVDEMKKQKIYGIDDRFAEDVVRAAPMHDLGKITVENSILLKPARLTDEEYAIMKNHSVKSGEFVNIILQGVEEKHFVDIAFNVARYHHERWDGRGYPEGLVGEMIPLEARVMAVADVYDALSSKRCYKEPLSPEEAAEIMVQGMGTQFDPNMLSVFLGCREKLEAYYRGN